MSEKTRRFFAVIFIIYCIVMLRLLFVPVIGGENAVEYHINLHPFETVRGYFDILRSEALRSDDALRSYAVINLVGNIVMFIPLGLLLPCVSRRMERFLPCIVTCVLSVACIELMQLISRTRSCDIDDLILNTVGALIGYASFAAVRRRRQI